MRRALRSTALMVLGLLLAAMVPRAGAQWLSQTNVLKPGWNAVYLHVDTSHATLDDLVGADVANPITEVWLWKPAPSTGQFVTSPQLPTGANPQWISWSRSLGPSSALHRLSGNVACLVRVGGTGPNYEWVLKGRPVPPRYEWTSSGLNFIGFPSPTPLAPSFEALFARRPELLQSAEIYRYPGGELGPGNPVRVFALRTTPVNRGEAYWIRTGQAYNRYFAPFELDLQNSEGAVFGDSVGQYRIRVRNLSTQPLSLQLALVPSETPPAGQGTIAGVPPILIRGDLNPANLTYGHTSLNAAPMTFNLAPAGQVDSERDVVIGLNRSELAGAPGTVHAAVLRWTDASILTRIDVPVSATVASRSGLWVGDASVQEVRHYLRNFEKDAAGVPSTDASGRYKVASEDTTLGTVARPFRLRLIVHHDGTSGESSLLQRVYYGLDAASHRVVATREELIAPAHLAAARRISAIHLPWSASNPPWVGTGAPQLGNSLQFTIPLGYDDQGSNPFLHTYHPDHDNLNATFDQPLPQGAESYGVLREVKLTFNTPASDFVSLTTDGGSLLGDYEETLSFRGQGTETRRYDVRGVFSLGRISDIATLTR